jgi:hypothetical protein
MPKRKKIEGRNSVDLATDFYSTPNANLVSFESVLTEDKMSSYMDGNIPTTEKKGSTPKGNSTSSVIKSASPPRKQEAIGRVVKRTLGAEGTSFNKKTGKDIGTFPTPGSGLTYGYGIDLKHLTKKQLVAAGATPEKITELAPWLGKTEKTLITEGLTLPDDEAFGDDQLYSRPEVSTTLSDNLAFKRIQKDQKKIRPLAKNLSGTAVEVLTSLRHWAGALGNIKKGNKLVVTKDGKRTNPVWNALKGGAATDKDLLAALKKTQAAHIVGWKRERIRKEIKKLKNA